MSAPSWLFAHGKGERATALYFIKTLHGTRLGQNSSRLPSARLHLVLFTIEACNSIGDSWLTDNIPCPACVQQSARDIWQFAL
jgi:hypothetical protein